MIVIEHEKPDGTFLTTYYLHCYEIEPNIYVGLKVERGDYIAQVGSTGNSTGPHLHFAIREGKYDGLFKGQVVDPAKYVKELAQLTSENSVQEKTEVEILPKIIQLTEGDTVRIQVNVTGGSSSVENLTVTSFNSAIAKVETIDGETIVKGGTAKPRYVDKLLGRNYLPTTIKVTFKYGGKTIKENIPVELYTDKNKIPGNQTSGTGNQTSGNIYPGNSTEEKVWNAFVNAGFSKELAAGVLGNMWHESRFNSKALELKRQNEIGYNNESYTNAVDSGEYSRESFISDHILENCGAGYGLTQWTYYNVKGGLYDYCKAKGYSIGDENAQITFLLAEFGVENEATEYVPQERIDEIKLNILAQDISTARKGAELFCKWYEKGGNAQAKGDSAEIYYEKHK